MKMKLYKKLFLPAVIMPIFLIGFELGGFQLALLSAANEFGINKEVMGSLVAAQFLAIALAPLFFGRLSDRTGKKRIILIFMVVYIVGCSMAASPGTIWLFVVGVFVVGVGFSVVESTVMAAVADAYEERSEKYLNFLQVFLGIGAVVSPLILQAVLRVSPGFWRASFLICAIAMAVSIPFILFSYFKPAPEAVREEQKPKAGNILVLLSFVFCMFIYMGVENGIAFYADSIFVLELNEPSFGAYAISLIWGFMAIARFFFGTRKKVPRLAVPISLFLLACFMAGIIFCENAIIMLCLFAACGAACGCVLPGIISAATSRYPAASGAVSSYCFVGGGFGGAFIPVLLGGVIGFTGISGSFVIMVAVAIVIGIIMWRNRIAADRITIN